MGKSNFMRIGALVLSVFVLGGAALWGWTVSTEDERSVVEVHLEEGKTETVSFENLCLVPGEQCEYELSFRKGTADRYDLSFDFAELKEGTLKKYARAKIESKGETLYDSLLFDLLEEESLSFTVDFKEKINTELKIIYYLPIDVGNEAQNAEALFELRLTASNE